MSAYIDINKQYKKNIDQYKSAASRDDWNDRSKKQKNKTKQKLLNELIYAQKSKNFLSNDKFIAVVYLSISFLRTLTHLILSLSCTRRYRRLLSIVCELNRSDSS